MSSLIILHFAATALCLFVGIGCLAQQRMRLALVFFALALFNASATVAAVLFSLARF